MIKLMKKFFFFFFNFSKQTFEYTKKIYISEVFQYFAKSYFANTYFRKICFDICTSFQTNII